MPIQTLLVEPKIHYSGKELRPHWIYENFDLIGDTIVAFSGSCQVAGHDLVDQVDKKADDFIRSESMLHFLVEHFNLPLPEAILRQRLLICLIQEQLNEKAPRIIRTADDLYYDGRKLSVSIATISPVSALIHVGLNISSRNTPIPTANLTELETNPEMLAKRIMKKYRDELASMRIALCKVKGV